MPRVGGRGSVVARAWPRHDVEQDDDRAQRDHQERHCLAHRRRRAGVVDPDDVLEEEPEADEQTEAHGARPQTRIHQVEPPVQEAIQE